MTVGYGFNATLTALPGMADELVELLLSALHEGNPGASEHCLVYLVCRSASHPDRVQVTEGWTSEADHHRVFAGAAAQSIVAAVKTLVAGRDPYTDYVPVGGKTAL